MGGHPVGAAPVRIYAIGDSSRGIVKIGISKAPDVRFRQLQEMVSHLGFATKLELLGSAPLPMSFLEQTVHFALRDGYHKGEWFRLDNADVQDFINQVIHSRSHGHGLMRPTTWLYRRGLLPEAWKPQGAESNHEITWRDRKERARAERWRKWVLDRIVAQCWVTPIGEEFCRANL